MIQPAGQRVSEIEVDREHLNEIKNKIEEYQQACLSKRKFYALFDPKEKLKAYGPLQDLQSMIPPDEVK